MRQDLQRNCSQNDIEWVINGLLLIFNKPELGNGLNTLGWFFARGTIIPIWA